MAARVRRPGVIGLLGIALVVGVAIGFTSGWFARGSPELPDPPETVAGQVPDVRGLPREWAELVLTSAGLLPVVNPVGPPNDDVVVAQSPVPGVDLPKSSNVQIEVRCVPVPCSPPRLGQIIFDPCSCATR